MNNPDSLEKSIPENFEKIIQDMINDLSVTFPEYTHLWVKWSPKYLETIEPEKKVQELEKLYKYCLSYYPERFFDILYNNEEIFNESSEKSALFLPEIDFKQLFNCENISSNTRKIMWNYLQLILMTIIGSIDSKEGFGDSTKQMFEGINEKDLYEKLNETMEGMSNFFQMMDIPDNSECNENEKNNTETEETVDEQKNVEDNEPSGLFEKLKGMPNINDLYGHLKTLFDGKIGSLAKELTEEIAGDMEKIFGSEEGKEQPTSTKEIIQNLLKNPEKMTSLIKTVSEKLNNKISKGEVSQDELMKEATDILGKMKDMGDMKQFQDMFKNISKMAGLGGKGKVDMNAFQQMTKQSSTREKLKERMLKKKALILQKELEMQKNQKNIDVQPELIPTDIPNNFKFKIDGEEINDNDFSIINPLVEPNNKSTIQKQSNPKKKKNKGKK